MADLDEFVRSMVWWCGPGGNLGYDQGNRWDVRVGGETDCSALVITILKRCGFATGSATYTGNMRSNLTARGWKVVSTYPKSASGLKAGDILLNDTHHVAVYVGGGQVAQASIDERGRISGGQAGDQTGRETNVTPFYVYRYGWSCALRYVGGKTVSENPLPVSSDKYNPNGYDSTYVRAVQTYLVRAGYSVGASGIDGILGADTFNATKAFQKAKGLVVDGIPGPQTLSALKADTSGQATASASAGKAVDGNDLLAIDGVPAARTIARLQQVMGVSIDGRTTGPAYAVLQAWLNSVVSAGHIKNLTGHSALVTDGVDGWRTWKVLQFLIWNRDADLVRHYASGWGFGDFVDGKAGTVTWKIVQHMLNESHAGRKKLRAY